PARKPAGANNRGGPPHKPPPFPPPFGRAAGSYGTESEFRHGPRSLRSACDGARPPPPPGTRYTRPPRTARRRQAPPAPTAARPVSLLHSGSSRTPCPCSPRSSGQRDASRPDGFETLPRQPARSLQTEELPQQFVAPAGPAVCDL